MFVAFNYKYNCKNITIRALECVNRIKSMKLVENVWEVDEYFQVKCALTQDCVMSAWLVNIFVGTVVLEASEKSKDC